MLDRTSHGVVLQDARTPPSALRSSRLDFLDAIRGFAAIYISAIHMVSLPPGGLALPPWLSTFVMFGGTAVTLFFVVSGFSLCLTMPSHERTGRPLISFYVKRVLRIAPLLYLWLGLSCLRELWRTGDWPSAEATLAQALLVYNLIPGYEEGVVWAGWTIGVEMAFYAVFPALYWLTPTIWARLTLYLTACLSLIALETFAGPNWLGGDVPASVLKFSVIRFAPMFVVGMIVFDLYKLLLTRPNQAAIGWLATTLALYGLVIIATRGSLLGLPDPNQAVAICYGSLILGLALATPAVLVNRLTAAFGRISYSFYLAHPVVIWTLFPAYAAIYERPELRLEAKFAIAFALTIAACIPVAALTYRLVELPAIRLSSKVIALARNAQPLARLRSAS